MDGILALRKTWNIHMPNLPQAAIAPIVIQIVGGSPSFLK
jgi:hypothetical protein